MRQTKQFDELVVDLRDDGWRVARTSKGHYRAYPPDKTKPIVHFSDSGDARAYPNTIAQLKASGYEPDVTRVRPAPKPVRVCQCDTSLGAQHDEECPTWPPQELATAVVAKVTKAPEIPAPVASVVVSKEDRMERLFRDLKDARAFLELATEHEQEREAQLKVAQAGALAARLERQEAADALRRAKQAFDLEFDATGAAA